MKHRAVCAQTLTAQTSKKIADLVADFHQTYLSNPNLSATGRVRAIYQTLTPKERSQTSAISEETKQTLNYYGSTRRDLLLSQLSDIMTAYYKALPAENLPQNAQLRYETLNDAVLSATNEVMRGRRSETAAVHIVTNAFQNRAKELSAPPDAISPKETDGLLAEDNGRRYLFETEPGNNCDRCLSFDGRYFTKEEAEQAGAVPPLHPNCNCKLVAEDGSELTNAKWAKITNNSTSDSSKNANITPERLELGLEILSGETSAIKEGRYVSNGAIFNVNNLDPLAGFTAKEHIEIYIAAAQKTDKVIEKIGFALQILASEPQKIAEMMADGFKQQAVMVGITDPNMIEAYGAIMSGYAGGLLGKTVSKGKASGNVTRIEKTWGTNENLINAATIPGKAGVTPVGRAFQKHAGNPSRAGSFVGEVTGNATQNTEQGVKYLNNILNNPKSTYTTRNTRAFGDVLDVRLPDGTGARWSADGKIFIMFLEKYTPTK